MRRTYAVVLAALLVVFVSFHPQSAGGGCGPDGCQQPPHASSAACPASCAAAILAASVVAFAFAAFCGRRPADQRPPAEFYLAPDPLPPWNLLTTV
ncbi:MAG: hypothetical protein IRY88_06790 [Rubrobacteraceae bacterium]|nr:hypothetical protein [Rubrobacteraceae bacterium]